MTEYYSTEMKLKYGHLDTCNREYHTTRTAFLNAPSREALYELMAEETIRRTRRQVDDEYVPYEEMTQNQCRDFDDTCEVSFGPVLVVSETFPFSAEAMYATEAWKKHKQENLEHRAEILAKRERLAAEEEENRRALSEQREREDIETYLRIKAEIENSGGGVKP